jgi:hypothetical protein
LIVGLANGSISGVPGVVRLSVLDHASNVLSSACLEAGHPLPHQVRLVNHLLGLSRSAKCRRINHFEKKTVRIKETL